MELRQLRYFITLAETRNFRRAAERLHMSQPPLTVAIRKLEQELGAPLFERGTRGVTLTPAGRAAVDAARATLAQAERFREAAREGATGARGRLTVGYVGSATFELLPRIVPEYRRRYPAVDLVLEEMTSVDIARGLIAGTLDVGLLRLPLMEVAAIDAQVIDADELHAALPAHSPLARETRLSLESLAPALHSAKRCQRAAFGHDHRLPCGGFRPRCRAGGGAVERHPRPCQFWAGRRACPVARCSLGAGRRAPRAVGAAVADRDRGSDAARHRQSARKQLRRDRP